MTPVDKPVRIYQCEDTVNGILSAVYDAGLSGYGHQYIKIQPLTKGQAENLELFSEYIFVKTDTQKAEKVISAVRHKISEQAYIDMMYAIASCQEDRATAVYQFITYGFSIGAKICGALQLPCVERVFEIKRSVQNEEHFFIEFLRFQEVQKNPPLLAAVIEPKHRIIPMVTEHFADRFMEEWFIIYDKTHREASFHYADGGWDMHILNEEEAVKLEELTEQQEEYQDLWKFFFNNIAIAERTNKTLQRNLMPLRLRKHVTEFR